MDNVGTYPGNAKNDMISSWGDANYLEASHLAVMQCHGSVWGPNLEYVPRLEKNVGQYEWGEGGKTQWVVIGGCDVLGYTINVDGTPSHHYPRANRWNDSFKGISGILGYRSSSWYRPTDRGLAASTARLFASRLLSGETFWNAWISATDYVHRVIGRKAEAAVFPNSREALRDTLLQFRSERTDGLDESSIRRRTVGRGRAPCYHYCHHVDANGELRCDHACSPKEALAAKHEVSPGFFLDPGLGDATQTLQTYRLERESNTTLGTQVLAGLGGEYQDVLGDNGDLLLRRWNVPRNGDGPQADELVTRFREAANADGITFMVDEREADLAGEGDGAIKCIALDPVISDAQGDVTISDYGVVLEWRDEDLIVSEGPRLKITPTGQSKTINLDRQALIGALAGFVEENWTVDVTDVGAMYLPKVDGGEWVLQATLAAHAIVQREETRQAVQVLL